VSILNKIFKKRIGIKRKENIDRALLIQIIFSIILVVAVIVTKRFGNNQTGEYLSKVKEKLGTTFNIKQTAKGISSIISNFSEKLGLDFGASDFAAPVSGRLTSNYGEDDTNNGIDIVSNIEAVKSISYGEVLAVGKNNKLSNYIVIESGSKTIIYAMLEEIFVSKGDEIKLGEIIGKLNNENKLLHIEIWEDGTSIDPSKLFRISE
jgi:murein DD-endopeptidase MepM/ murein hydrolase activator NlpD